MSRRSFRCKVRVRRRGFLPKAICKLGLCLENKRSTASWQAAKGKRELDKCHLSFFSANFAEQITNAWFVFTGSPG